MLRRVFGVLAALLLVSCANKSLTRLEKFAKPLGRGDYLSSLELVRSNYSLYGDGSSVLWHLDMGILHHYAGQYDSSIVHLRAAEEQLDELYARSLSNEALAILTNDNQRPYRSRPYEQILLKQFQMLNYLALGRTDGALVEVRAANLVLDRLYQQSASKYNDNGMFHYLASLAWEQGGELDNSLISLYKSLKAYQDVGNGIPAQVREMGWHRLNQHDRSSDLAGLKIEAPPQMALAEALESSPSEIVVLAYTGRSPVLDELKFWGTYVRDGMLVYHFRDPSTGQTVTQALPAPGLPPSELAKAQKGQSTASGTTFSVAWAMPKMRTTPSKARRAAVQYGKKVWKSQQLDDTEELLQRNLQDQETAVLTRTVVRVVLRTMAAQVGKSKVRTDNPLINLAVNIGTDIFSANLEQADLRLSIWFPRSFEIIRIPVQPGTHSLEVDITDDSGRVLGTQEFKDIQVRRGQKRFLLAPYLQ